MMPAPPLLRELSVFRLKRSVLLGLKSLWMHKLRSLLTAMGIVFGVCSVIAMLAIGEGARFGSSRRAALRASAKAFG